MAIDQAKVERGKIELANGKIKSSYTGEKQNNINLLINEMIRQGITNPYSQVGMLAVIGKESDFIPKNENMNYSKERLPEVWGVFSKTGQMVPKGQGKSNYNDLAVQYEHKPEELANFVYGQKPNGMRDNAYGNTQPGDGWKYRGRGFNGITFKSGYEKYAAATGLDLVNNPDMINDPATSAKVAVLYFINTIKPQGIDLNSFTSTEDATKVFARANAGWESPQNVQDWAYANAAKILPNFTIEPTATV
jgi:putative chitinase